MATHQKISCRIKTLLLPCCHVKLTKISKSEIVGLSNKQNSSHKLFMKMIARLSSLTNTTNIYLQNSSSFLKYNCSNNNSSSSKLFFVRKSITGASRNFSMVSVSASYSNNGNGTPDSDSKVPLLLVYSTTLFFNYRCTSYVYVSQDSNPCRGSQPLVYSWACGMLM